MGTCCVQYVLIYSLYVLFCIFILCKTYYLKAMISGEILIPYIFKEVIQITFFLSVTTKLLGGICLIYVCIVAMCFILMC